MLVIVFIAITSALAAATSTRGIYKNCRQKDGKGRKLGTCKEFKPFCCTQPRMTLFKCGKDPCGEGKHNAYDYKEKEIFVPPPPDTKENVATPLSSKIAEPVQRFGVEVSSKSFF